MIKVGDTIPNINLVSMGANNAPEPKMAHDIFGGKKSVLFGVPGAFTPTCSAKHVPGFLAHSDALAKKGVQKIACVSVNDVFVMHAWGKDQNVGDKIAMLADGSADFTRATGLEFDLTAKGLGLRCQRFAMVIDNNKIVKLWVEEVGEFKVSSAEYVLENI